MKINEIAEIANVSVRTLHYYDKIGLLKPESVTAAGYRIYDEKSLIKLQQILFFRELSFPLEEIAKIINDDAFDEKAALEKQRQLLIMKRNRLDEIISLTEKRIKGDNTMSFKEFDSGKIEELKEKYAEEAKNRWGGTKEYKESEEKRAAMSDSEKGIMNEEGKNIIAEFAELRFSSPDSCEALKLAEKWRNFITENCYECTKEILSCLADMYTGDERFTANLDSFGAGTAEFMAKAIKNYCAQ